MNYKFQQLKSQNAKNEKHKMGTIGGYYSFLSKYIIENPNIKFKTSYT